MIEQIKLAGMTAILTLMIWISADRLVTQEATVSAVLKLAPATADPDILLSTPQEPFQLTVVGPRATVGMLQTIAPLPIRLQVPDMPTGITALPLRDMLAEQWKEYPGIGVADVRPAKLDLRVDRLITKEVPLSMQGLSLPYDVKPQLQPTTVQVRLRESLFNELSAGRDLTAIDITTDAERILREQPSGKNVVVLVPLDDKVFGEDAAIKPKAVEVRATVTSQRTTAEIPTVPILLAINFANVQKPFRAVPRDGSELVTQTIKVTGPTAEVAKLVRGETRAYGIIQLKDEHFAEREVVKPLTPEFLLPPGLELSEKPAPVELLIVDLMREKPPDGSKSAP